MCRVLKVSRSSYYFWLKDPDGKRGRKRKVLEKQIQDAYITAKGRNGSPRLAKDLQMAGTLVSRPTVAKHMKRMGLRSKLSKRFKVTTNSSHKYQVAPNILNRNFYWEKPAVACVSDLTYIPTTDGFIYLTVVLDLFDRKPIGWSISDGMNASQTVIPAIMMANRNRKFSENMVFHSDRGIQYACKSTVNVLKSFGIVQSMSRKGNCWDNAVSESFFKSFKTELIYGNKLKTKEEMSLYIFEYIEAWYNRKRRHSALGNLTINEFWMKYKMKNQLLTNVA